VAEALNYGLDRVRFLAPVTAGARIRDRIVLQDVERKDGNLLLKTRNTIEIEGEPKPALIADALSLLVLPGPTPAGTVTTYGRWFRRRPSSQSGIMHIVATR